jgi:hypothetical protein
MRGQNTEFLDVKARGTDCYHSALKGYYDLFTF